jgi:hypothetical protein
MATEPKRDRSVPGRASPVSGDADASASDREATTGAPRWAKVFILIGVLVLILLFAIEHLVFERLRPGGDMRHMGTQSAPAEPGSNRTTPG